MKSPFTPNIKEEDDTSRFDDFDEEEPWFTPDSDPKNEVSSKKNKRRKDINFPGYTYKKEVEEQKTKLV